jgi:hypothetical protein
MLMVVLTCVAVVEAEDFVCGNGVRPQCAQTTGATRYIRSMDPSKVTDPTCVLLDENTMPGITASQRALVETVTASHAHGRCHLKVDGSILVEMTQPEKDVVNTAIAIAAMPGEDMQEEVANEDLCKSATLDIITQKMTNQRTNLQATFDTARASIQTDIDAVTQATIKTNLAAMFDKLYQSLSDEADRTYTLIEKLARCDRARAGP